MKFKHTLSLLALASCAALSTSVMAQSSGSQVTIVGGISASICDVTINGGRSSTVTLPNITSNRLPAVGSTAGDTNFVVNLRNCDPSVSQVQMNFSSPRADAITGRINSGLGGVSLQVLGGTRQVKATQTQSENLVSGDYSVAVNTARAADLTYTVRYFREGQVTTGTLNATANLTVAYL